MQTVERQTDRQTDRQRQTERDRNRERERERERQKQRERDRQTETERQRQRDRDRQTQRDTDTDRRVDDVILQLRDFLLLPLQGLSHGADLASDGRRDGVGQDLHDRRVFRGRLQAVPDPRLPFPLIRVV